MSKGNPILSAATVSVSKAVVHALKKGGVTHLFGIPSIHNIGLYQALREEPSIRHILCRHESSAVHMADGYARAGKGIGVVITSTGPGAGFMVPPLLEAWGSLSPVLAITTNIPTKELDRGTGTLHELPGQDLLFNNITKKQYCLRSEKDAPGMIREAMETALSGRPGPVYVEVPTDLWDKNLPMPEDRSGLPLTPTPGKEPTHDLHRAARLLREAELPVVIAGTAAFRAGIGNEIRLLCESVGAPLLTCAEAKGLIPEDHPLAFGNAARRGVVRELLGTSDLALAIGTRLRRADYYRRGVTLPRLIHIDWDHRWIGRNYPADMAIVGDLRRMAQTLSNMVRSERPTRTDTGEKVAGMRGRLMEERETIARRHVEMAYLDVLRGLIPDGTLVIDNTLLGYWAEYFYESPGPGGLITAKGSSIIGFSLPAAMGLALACPERKVVALIGDGGFLYAAQELATCRRHGIAFPVIVVNDGAYGMIGVLQRQIYGQGGFETNLVNPDWTAFAASFGIVGTRVHSPQGLEQAVRSALNSSEMRLIELAVSFQDNPFATY